LKRADDMVRSIDRMLQSHQLDKSTGCFRATS